MARSERANALIDVLIVGLLAISLVWGLGMLIR